MENIIHYLLYEESEWISRIIGVVVTIVVFSILAQVSKKIISGVAKKTKLDDHLGSLLARTSNISILIFGLVTAFGTLGINISALVASLGLTGFALGFALKDIISNLISGILILLYRPFEIGDRIGILSYEGIVISIDLRYTEIDSEGNKVLIPNSKLFSDPITILQNIDEGAKT